MNPTTGGVVLLVNPRATYVNEIAQKCYPPLNLLYLAAVLREKGWEVRVLDANALRMSDETLADYVSRMKPLVFGMSLYSEILKQARDLTRLVKRCHPGTTVVVGGPHASATPETTLEQFDSVDAVLRGECEDSFPRYCEAVRDNKGLRGIPGIVFRAARGEGAAPEPLIFGPEPTRPDVTRIPWPARDLVQEAYDLRRYYTLLVRERPVDTIMTSRGCPHRCGFCYNMNYRYRGRTAEDVVHELTTIRERGIRNVEIVDDTFTAHRSRAIETLDLIIKEKLDISFRIKSRANIINPEFARKARQAGVYLIAYGMESGVQRILDAMQKGTRVEDNARACVLTKAHGMACHSSWIIGYPGETPETAWETARFIIKMKPTTANFGILRPYPNTDVYNLAKAEGMLRGDWTPETDDIPWVQLPWVKQRDDLRKLHKAITRRVYFRPYYAWAFGSDILRNANWTLARYAVQEARKVLLGR